MPDWATKMFSMASQSSAGPGLLWSPTAHSPARGSAEADGGWAPQQPSAVAVIPILRLERLRP